MAKTIPGARLGNGKVERGGQLSNGSGRFSGKMILRSFRFAFGVERLTVIQLDLLSVAFQLIHDSVSFLENFQLNVIIP